MAPRPGSPTPTLAEHAARRNLTCLPFPPFLPPAAPPPSGREAIGQQPPRRAAPLASCRGPGRDTPTGFPMAGLGWTGLGGRGTGWGGVGSRGLGLREGGKARKQRMGRRRNRGPRMARTKFSTAARSRNFCAASSSSRSGGKESGKGDRVRGTTASLPPPNHLSPTPGPRVLPGDTVFSRMVISSMAEVAAATPPKTTVRPLGRRL